MIKSKIDILRCSSLINPVMICGLPGIGSIANVTIAYLLHKLNAQLFAKIKSPYFQDVAIPSSETVFVSPLHKLFYWKSHSTSRDLIFLFGNTQTYTSYGQYELCSTILDFIDTLHCRSVISLGGIQSDRPSTSPQLFGIFSNLELKNKLCALGIHVMEGRVYGMAGLLVGLAALKNMTAFCLLAETSGQVDVEATTKMVDFLKDYLQLQLDTTDLPDLLRMKSPLKRVGDFVSIPSNFFLE